MGANNSTATPSAASSQLPGPATTLPAAPSTPQQRPHAVQTSPSTSTEPTTALWRARLRMRRRRMKKKGKGLERVPRVVTIDRGDGEGKTAERVARQLVGEKILLFWPALSVWVDCEVMKYGGGFGKLEGLHEVRYEDGVCEWKALKRFRVVVDGKAFTKAVYGKWAGLQDKTGRTY